ncbi:hypothetical protein BDF22DRAFT_732094 [Syncephalis plumigaleata]|nr:hypothetical protein BDF22DRAFT_732094 [Syncephalis plumigaleata]
MTQVNSRRSLSITPVERRAYSVKPQVSTSPTTQQQQQQQQQQQTTKSSHDKTEKTAATSVPPWRIPLTRRQTRIVEKLEAAVQNDDIILTWMLMQKLISENALVRMKPIILTRVFHLLHRNNSPVLEDYLMAIDEQSARLEKASDYVAWINYYRDIKRPWKAIQVYFHYRPVAMFNDGRSFLEAVFNTLYVKKDSDDQAGNTIISGNESAICAVFTDIMQHHRSLLDGRLETFLLDMTRDPSLTCVLDIYREIIDAADGVSPEPVVLQLIYSKLKNAGKLEKADEFYRIVLKENLDSLGLEASYDKTDDAQKYFLQMITKTFHQQPDGTYTGPDGRALIDHKLVHVSWIEFKIPITTLMCRRLIDVFMLQRNVKKAERILHLHMSTQQLERSGELYTADSYWLYIACEYTITDRPDDAKRVLDIYNKTKSEKLDVSGGYLLDIYMSQYSTKRLRHVTKFIEEQGMALGLKRYTMLMDFYGKRKKINDVLYWYKRACEIGEEGDIFVITCLIQAYSYAQRNDKAMETYAMARKKYGYCINNTSLSVLCDVAGYHGCVDTLESVWKDALADKVKPNENNYASLVEAYWRIGRIETATRVLVRQMPEAGFPPNYYMLMTLIYKTKEAHLRHLTGRLVAAMKKWYSGKHRLITNEEWLNESIRKEEYKKSLKKYETQH